MDKASSEEQPIPEEIGSYKIQRTLGAGGMGTVYLAENKETEQLVALKVLPASMARESGFVARFEREIDALARVHSSHIVELYGHGNEDDTHFYAMEFVDGPNIAELLRKKKRLEWRTAIEYGVQICQALKSAHDAGIIHRDLKPSNLMVGPDGQLKLTDFGVARIFASSKLTKTGGILGTAEYMSPEQAKGGTITASSDIYAVGAVLYAMITGRPPFVGDSAVDIIRKHQLQLPDHPKSYVPQIPHWLDEVIMQCLQKDPKDRPATAYTLSRTLASIPAKVELSNSEVTWAGPMDAEQQTVALKEHNKTLGATFVRDLLRGELSELDRIPSFLKPFESIWLLSGLLVLCVGLIIYFWPDNSLSPQEKFDKGVQLFDRGESYWLEARDEYFLPLKQENAIAFEDRLLPYLQKIDNYAIRKQYGFKGRPNIAEKSETQMERILKMAGEYYELGDYERARELLTHMLRLTKGNEQFTELRTQISELLSSLPEMKISQEERKLIQKQHEQITQLIAEGRVDEARQLWESVRQVFGNTEAPQALLSPGNASSDN